MTYYNPDFDKSQALFVKKHKNFLRIFNGVFWKMDDWIKKQSMDIIELVGSQKDDKMYKLFRRIHHE